MLAFAWIVSTSQSAEDTALKTIDPFVMMALPRQGCLPYKGALAK